MAQGAQGSLLIPARALLTTFLFCKGAACHLSLAGREHFWQFGWHHCRVEPPLPASQNKLHRVQCRSGLPVPRVSWLSLASVPFGALSGELCTSLLDL